MIETSHPHWQITTIDQSIAAADIRQRRDPSPRAVRISASVSGPRYARWYRAIMDDDQVTADSITTHVVSVGPTFQDAYEQICDMIIEIESTQAIPA